MATTRKEREATRHSPWLAWGILVCGSALSVIAAARTESGARESARREFDFARDEIRQNIAARLAANGQVLHAGAALFATSDTVTRRDWKTFTDGLAIQRFLPGTQGIGYAQVVPPDQRERLEARVRAEGYPDFAIKPAGRRSFYTTIILLEPLSGRNLRAFGYDMSTESVRRAALERARDEGQIALTGRVTLVQETNKDVQAGALMFVPVYRKGADISTVEKRRSSLLGWVYSPYRMNDLMAGTLRGWSAAGRDRPLSLRIYDGDSATAASLLYDSRTVASSPSDSSRTLHGRGIVEFAGRRWTLVFEQPLRSGRWPLGPGSATVLLGGLLVTGLLTGLVRSLQGTGARARALADHLVLELRESEESYRNQFSTNSTAMLLIDPETGGIIDANEAALAFYGHSREAIRRLHLADINTMPPEEIAQAMASVPGTVGRRLQFQHRLADGTLRNVELSSSRIQVGGRTILHSIVHDITERKRAEDSLKEIAGRLELATRAAGVGIWEYDIDSNRLVWDDQMYALYGIGGDRFAGAYEAWRAGVHPDDRDRGDAEIQAALEGRKEFDTEFRVVRPDGSIRHIRAMSLVQRDARGRAVRMIGTNWDITEQKMSEEALLQSRTEISRLLQTTDQGIYGIDPHGRCTFVNRSGLRMIGYDLPECLGRDMHELIHHSLPDGSPYPVEDCPIFRAKLVGKEARLDSEVFWRKDGSSFPVDYSAYPILENGAIQGAVITFSDVTERKRAEDALRSSNHELEQATARAEQANAAKSEFLANMSHEIRTPMNGVIGLTGLLLDGNLEPEQRRYAQLIRQSGEALLALINDILDFSKIEAGRLELEILDFDLRALLDDIAQSQAPRIHAKGIEFVYDLPPDLPERLRGDPGRLRQIILNLLSNATKFTSGGQILLKVSSQEDTGGEVAVRFAVVDSGIGIPRDKQSILFQKFTQVDASTSRQFGGTGLGLAISRQLAGMMGGTMGLESEEGRGSEFWFTARLRRQAEAAADAPSRASFEGVRTLVLDDSPDSRRTIVGQLQAWGAVAEGASDGPAALGAVHSALERGSPFQVAFVDLRMPGMDGIAVVRALRADPKLADLRIVLLAPLGVPYDSGNSEGLDVSGHVTKPFVRSDLLDALADALGSQAPLDHAGTSRTTDQVVRLPSARILLAEDNPTNQLVATELLRKLGLRVDAVADGAEAVKAMEHIPYDLVLMDAQMPRLDGFEATSLIRRLPSASPNRDVPIIALTANAMEGDRERCLAAGMNDYLTKPISPAALHAMLERWLPASRDGSDRADGLPIDSRPAPQEEADLPDLDLAGLLGRTLGDRNLARKVLESARRELDRLQPQFEAAVSQSDLPAIAQFLHGIKGMSENVGATALGRLARALEAEARRGNSEAFKDAALRLATMVDRFRDAVGRLDPEGT